MPFPTLATPGILMFYCTFSISFQHLVEPYSDMPERLFSKWPSRDGYYLPIHRTGGLFFGDDRRTFGVSDDLDRMQNSTTAPAITRSEGPA
ncbi:uncharacterized protein BT62DRAFT_1013365 [Guyanagaster necrorhizus]|uniref:Uncharacterized protein n=1 Tax=Guyanagaster necrorhizus TaxID=856835 RepID=A0A9P8AMJ7_9AGAR|nr:uncharacterized protein BT62DRAFT_1013365 [Guyanagaster necrorhizus MCA 3950]KAG7439912.1 hypothetical protein BT62DRAFT_1013365 [Guyanagaster necrorhizus MCA 3950]